MTKQTISESKGQEEHKPRSESVLSIDAVAQKIAQIVGDRSDTTMQSEEHQLSRLAQALRNRKGRFGLLFAVCNEISRREQLTRDICDLLTKQHPVRLYLTGEEPSLLKALLDAPGGSEALFVFNVESLLPSSDEQRARREGTSQELQHRREQFRKLERPLVLWMPEYVYSLIGIQAVDFWSWQGGAFFFSGQPSVQLLHGEDLAPSSTMATRLPSVSLFVGRASEVKRITHALKEGNQLVAVEGMAGVGKTHLAIQVAQLLRDQYDGVVFIKLGASSRIEDGLADTIQTFYPAEQLPDDLSSLTALYRSVLRVKRALIILDDVSDAKSIRPFQPPPGSALLITTRKGLAIPNAVSVSLDLLPREDALDLLLSISPGLIPSEAARLAEVCGYPSLALTLAASVITKKGISTDEYIQRLFEIAAGTPGKDRERESGPVRAILGLSYNLLGGTSQKALSQLSVFVDVFDRTAARYVVLLTEGEDNPQIVDVQLDILVKSGFLTYNTEVSRFALHPLVQQFAGRQLGEDALVCSRYATYYTRVGAEAGALYLRGGSDTARGLALFDQEITHLRSAFDWLREHDPVGLISLVQGVANIAALRLPQHEWIAWLEAQAKAARATGNRDSEGVALNNLGTAYSALGDVRRAAKYYEQALIIAREIGDRQRQGNALGNLGAAYANLGDVRRAIEYHEQALAIAREIGDRQRQGNALGNLGAAYAKLGDVRRAIEYHEQALAISREIGDRLGEGMRLGNLGAAYADLGDVRRAIEYHEQALAISREIGDRLGEGMRLGNLGAAYANLGDVQRAAEYYQQALTIAREIGDRRGEGNALGNLGTAYANLGDVRRAIEYHEQALAIAREIGDRHREGNALGNLGAAYTDLGDVRRAIEYHEQALTIAREIGDRRGEANVLGNLGIAYTNLGDVLRAIEYYEQALIISQEIGDAYSMAVNLANLAVSYARQGDTRRALPLAQQAAGIFVQIGSPYAQQVQKLVAQLQGDTITASEPSATQEFVEQFKPFIVAVVAAARGNVQAREQVEGMFDQLTHANLPIVEPIKRIWDGERNETALTEGIDENSVLIVHLILELLKGGGEPAAVTVEPVQAAFESFQQAKSLGAMQAAVDQYSFMTDADFIGAIDRVIQEQVPPEHKPIFEQRLTWLRQIAGK